MLPTAMASPVGLLCVDKFLSILHSKVKKEIPFLFLCGKGQVQVTFSMIRWAFVSTVLCECNRRALESSQLYLHKQLPLSLASWFQKSTGQMQSLCLLTPSSPAVSCAFPSWSVPPLPFAKHGVFLCAKVLELVTKREAYLGNKPLLSYFFLSFN